MATPNEKLANSLEALREATHESQLAIRANSLSRVHRERLTANGYLKPIVKGWFMPATPADQDGDTTAWYIAMRDFISQYCEERFGPDWYCNAEISLLLNTGITTMPRQILIHAVKGKNNALKLPADCSLFDYTVRELAPLAQRTIVDGMRVLTLETALIRATPNAWLTDPETFRLALEQIQDPTVLNRILLEGGNTVIAGRIAGGMQAVGKTEMADSISTTMRAVGYPVRVENPFNRPVLPARQTPESPYCARIRSMWASMRDQTLSVWRLSPRNNVDAKRYLADAELRYTADAYHSLSIEGYKVTTELIEKVRKGDWSPDFRGKDGRDHNALAARGYYEAHEKVIESIAKVLAAKNPGEVLRTSLQAWNLALWRPHITAGILKPSELAGWRNHPIYIRNSQHTPLPFEAVRDAMPVFFELLTEEDNPAVRAVLGHFVFVFIHPYMDGNGRLGRFILNLMLSSGAWPWTVMPVERRGEYMAALEQASVNKDIRPFALLIESLVLSQSTD